MEGRVAVAVLGPCAATVAGDDGPDPVELTPVTRRILARLAIEGDRTVTIDELSHAIWGDDPPKTARASLHNQISRLRRALGEEAIATDGIGYRLVADTDVAAAADEVARAERALRSGRAPAAHTLAQAALARWRGPSLVDLHDVTDVQSHRRHLDELRCSAENLRLEAAVQRGLVAWGVPEAERLVAETPHDEHRWALLVTALDRAGRRGEALGAFDRARTFLRDTLGLDPGPALRAAEAAVLDPPETPAGRAMGPLVGRSAEVDRIVAAALTEDWVLVRGEEGAGKSAVLGEVARHLRSARRAVATTRCTANPAAALAPLRELLEDLRLAPDPVLGPVDGFLAALGERAAEQPVVLVVDDLHQAGPTTRATLTAATARPGVTLVASVAERADRPHPEGGVEVVLGPLEPDAVASLAQQVGGTDLDPAITTAWLVEQSGGNPLYLQELLSDPTSSSPTTSASLRDLVRVRVASLDDLTRSALEVAAVCGPDAPRSLVAGLAPPSGLQFAVDAGLLVEAADGTLRFRHGAVARVIYADLPPGRATELHHAAGTALATAGASAAAVAHHLIAAQDLDPVRGAASADAAAREATAQGAHRDAAAWFERAARAAAQLGPAGAASRVRSEIGQGDALRLAGDAAHVEVLFAAADEAAELADPTYLGEAAFALLQLGGTTQTGALDERAAEVADRALRLLEDPEQRAVVSAAASLTHSMTGDPDRCRDLFGEAEATATTPAARRQVLPFTYLALGHPDDLDRREQLAAELTALGRDADDPVATFEGLHLTFSVGLQRADGAGVRRALADMEGLVERVGDVGRRWAVRYQAAAVAHLDDDLERAERLSEEALTLFAPVSASRATATYGGQLLPLRLAQGRLAELAPILAGFLEEQPAVPAWHAAYALAIVDHDPATARHHAVRALDDAPTDFTWLPGLVIGARAAARTDDEALIERYRSLLLPYAGLVCWQGTCAYGPVDLPLAALATALGEHDAARSHAQVAAALSDRLGAPVFRRELHELGLT